MLEVDMGLKNQKRLSNFSFIRLCQDESAYIRIKNI